MPISEHTVAKIKTQLEGEIVKVEKRIEELKAQDPFSDPARLNDNAASDTDANEESTHDRYQALKEELMVRLQEIKAALLRITQGTYGVCDSCGNPIEEERLAAMPTARLCIADGQKQSSEA